MTPASWVVASGAGFLPRADGGCLAEGGKDAPIKTNRAQEDVSHGDKKHCIRQWFVWRGRWLPSLPYVPANGVYPNQLASVLRFFSTM